MSAFYGGIAVAHIVRVGPLKQGSSDYKDGWRSEVELSNGSVRIFKDDWQTVVREIDGLLASSAKAEHARLEVVRLQEERCNLHEDITSLRELKARLKEGLSVPQEAVLTWQQWKKSGRQYLRQDERAVIDKALGPGGQNGS